MQFVKQVAVSLPLLCVVADSLLSVAVVEGASMQVRSIPPQVLRSPPTPFTADAESGLASPA
jgi:hypothetical protein